MAIPVKTKTYNDTFIYSYANEASNKNLEKTIVSFVHDADRINPADGSFKPVLDDLKLKQTTTVFFKLVMRKDVVLCINTKELPASMKVFVAKDIRIDKKKRVFVDCTGIVKFENGYWVCREIDKLCSYLFAAMINLLYFINPSKITANSQIIKASTQCFAKMFTGILDNLRTVNFEDNRTKIFYIVSVYYLYNVMGKDIGYARSSAMNISKITSREAMAYDIYYDMEKDLVNIDTLVNCLADTFHLKDLTTGVIIDRWSFVYGKGTMYGLEYLPAFLDILAYAYIGAYINNQKSIELICRGDMIEVATTLLKLGADEFNNGMSTLESALSNRRVNKPLGLTEAQEMVLTDESNFSVRISGYRPYVDNIRPNNISSIGMSIPKIRMEVSGVVNSDFATHAKMKKLNTLQENLKRGKAYRTSRNSTEAPISSDAVKTKFFNEMMEIVDDAKAKLSNSDSNAESVNKKKEISINEGYINQLLMPFKAGGSTALWKVFKDHKYEGYLKIIDSCKDESDIRYLQQDMSIGKRQFKVIRERIQNCQHGKNAENATYYDNINKLYMSHGVTPKDVDLTNEWYDTVARKRLNEKAKEIRDKK